MLKTNDPTQLLTRREFTVESALALLAGVSITISACGGDTETSPTPTTSGATGTISANHGHTATVEAARVSAGTGFSLDIRGSADHPHTVELTADDLTRIGARMQVTKTSSTDNLHQHTVTFN